MIFSFSALLVALFSLVTCTGDQPEPIGASPGNPTTDVTGPVTGEVLVGAGDIARCDATRDEATATLLDGIPGTVFTVGDNVYEGTNGAAPDFNACYAPSWGRHKARTRPALGHREGFSPGSATYYDYFGAAAGERGKGYYSYDLGTWHVIVLNSSQSLAAGSAQETWLRADLAANNRVCSLAMFHVPLFTSTSSQYNVAVKPAWDALYAAGAELIINAHAEVYERFRPQTPGEVLDTATGIQQITVGTGGISTNAFATIRPNSQVRSSGTYGVLKLVLGAGEYSWEFIPIAGQTFRDSGTGTCHGTGAPVNQAPTAAPGGPYASEGAVAFDGSASSDPDGNLPLTYAWAFGDGTTGTGATPNHTYPDGQYTAALTVTDAKGLAGAPVSTLVTVGNLPPVVNVGPDATAFPGTIFPLTATWSDPGLTDGPWTYTIEWGDGTSESGTRTDQSPVTGGHGYATPGTYTARVTITDKDGGVGTDALVVTASTNAVMVGAGNISACYNDRDEATAQLIDATPGQVITLGDNAFPDGSNTDYANCYQPTWGRHKARTRPVVGNHEYQTPNAAGYYAYFGNAAGETGKGWYTYTLGAWRVIVLNDQVPFDVGSEQYAWLGSVLNTMTEQCTVAMWHVPLFLSSNTAGYTENPSRRVLWNRLYEAGVDLVLNGHQHHYERFAPMTPDGVPDNGTGIREINVGTGGESIVLPTVGIHPYSEVRAAPFGVIKLTLNASSYSWEFLPIPGQTFTDAGSTNCHGAPALNNAPPTAQPGGPYASESPTITFDGSASSDPENQIPFTYAWTFGDGTTGTGVNPTHTYAGNGAYTVALTVTDSRGGVSALASTTATVANVAPTVSVTGVSTIPVAAMYAVSATFTDPGGSGDAPFNYTIEWGDGTSESSTKSDISPITGSHGYAAEGSFTIRVSVTDKDGGTGSGTKAITTTAPVLLAAGDIADCDRTGDDQTATLLDGQVGVVAALGDNAYLDGTNTEYANCYEPTWGRHKSRTKPTSGNHDYNTPQATGYYAYFGSAAGDPTKGYYTYTLGTWYIIVLNSQIDMYVGSPQEVWLRQELAAHPNQCVLAYWHYPRWTTILNRTTLDAVKPLWDALYEYGADVILNGHDHAYQRWVPQTPAGAVDNAFGIPEFAVGTGGGEGLYQFGPNAPNTAVRNNQTFGVIKFTLRSGGYDWQFLPVAGQTFTDAGSANCHGAPASTNLPPIANPGGPYTGESAVTFNGSGSSDPDGNLPLTYAWNFGDGSTGTGVGPSHTYATEGTYTVSLVVTDNKGKPSVPVTTTATIANVAPAVNAGADATSGPGQAFNVNATFTDAGGPSDAPWSYTITWGDGATANGTKSTISAITGSHTYPAVGDFVVRVTVTDNEGAAGFDELTVHVGDAQVLVGAGDIARCDATRDEATAALLDTIPGTVFTVGDNVIEGANNGPPDFNTCYAPSWGRHKARTRPALGHREGFSTGSATYYDYFGAAAGPRGKGYYSYDLGAWHVIVLNSAQSMAVGSAQEVWLRADLAANPAQCTVAIFHVPLFTSTSSQYNVAVKPAWDALYAAGAELVINAHAEVYERFAPQTPAEVADPVNGIRQITVGTGGISHNAFAATRANSQVRDAVTYGVLKLTLSSGSYSWKFIPIAGQTFTDAGSGVCH